MTAISIVLLPVGAFVSIGLLAAGLLTFVLGGLLLLTLSIEATNRIAPHGTTLVPRYSLSARVSGVLRDPKTLRHALALLRG